MTDAQLQTAVDRARVYPKGYGYAYVARDSWRYKDDAEAQPELAANPHLVAEG